jgi:hypothetical protein
MRYAILFSMMMALFVAAGCGGNGGTGDDGRVDGQDVMDTADQLTDTPPDTVPDTTPDTEPDTEPDGADVPADLEGCTDDSECGEGMYCQFPRGECEPPGTCVERGDGDCPAVYHPLCGCDGVTYGNNCEAQYAGASILHAGECGEPACTQGDPEGLCGEGQFCEGPAASCDDPDATGECMDTPEACDTVYDPVCGCDGETYGNDCSRQVAGVWLDYEGECEAPPSCTSDDECVDTEFCEFMAGACEPPGTCVSRGDGLCPEIYSPVCGCDGNTYDNDCFRQYAGVSLDSTGECP